MFDAQLHRSEQILVIGMVVSSVKIVHAIETCLKIHFWQCHNILALRCNHTFRLDNAKDGQSGFGRIDEIGKETVGGCVGPWVFFNDGK
jgi:hypothetical protein